MKPVPAHAHKVRANQLMQPTPPARFLSKSLYFSTLRVSYSGVSEARLMRQAALPLGLPITIAVEVEIQN